MLCEWGDCADDKTQKTVVSTITTTSKKTVSTTTTTATATRAGSEEDGRKNADDSLTAHAPSGPGATGEAETSGDSSNDGDKLSESSGGLSTGAKAGIAVGVIFVVVLVVVFIVRHRARRLLKKLSPGGGEDNSTSFIPELESGAVLPNIGSTAKDDPYIPELDNTASPSPDPIITEKGVKYPSQLSELDEISTLNTLTAPSPSVGEEIERVTPAIPDIAEKGEATTDIMAPRAEKDGGDPAVVSDPQGPAPVGTGEPGGDPTVTTTAEARSPPDYSTTAGDDLGEPGERPQSEVNDAATVASSSIMQEIAALEPGDRLSQLTKLEKELEERRRTLEEIRLVQDQQSAIREEMERLKAQDG